MNERIYSQKITKLRSQERIELIEVNKVIEISLDNINLKNVLDIGTGSGLFGEAFALNGLKTYGIDINQEMIEAVKEYVPEGEFLLAPAESIPYPDHFFDLVFLGHILHEADDNFKVIQEAKRVAKQRIVILEWPYITEEIGPPIEHRISLERISELIQNADLRNIENFQLQHMVLIRIDIKN